jgi:hypothetical protein
MPVPETTSAENLFHYVGGKCLVAGRGEAWREIKASVIALPPVVDALHMPSVSEPVLVWITSGEIEVQERENDGPWLTTRVKKGVTYWKSLTSRVQASTNNGVDDRPRRGRLRPCSVSCPCGVE